MTTSTFARARWHLSHIVQTAVFEQVLPSLVTSGIGPAWMLRFLPKIPIASPFNVDVSLAPGHRSRNTDVIGDGSPLPIVDLTRDPAGKTTPALAALTGAIAWNLLNPVDLAGAVVTADAAHARLETAGYTAGVWQADYLLTVKDNQPGPAARHL